MSLDMTKAEKLIEEYLKMKLTKFNVQLNLYFYEIYFFEVKLIILYYCNTANMFVYL